MKRQGRRDGSGWRHETPISRPHAWRTRWRSITPPKYGSWRTIAEIERSVLSRQCLDRRLLDAGTLASEIAVWQDRGNVTAGVVDGRCTTTGARIKLKRLSPSRQE